MAPVVSFMTLVLSRNCSGTISTFEEAAASFREEVRTNFAPEDVTDDSPLMARKASPHAGVASSTTAEVADHGAADAVGASVGAAASAVANATETSVVMALFVMMKARGRILKQFSAFLRRRIPITPTMLRLHCKSRLQQVLGNLQAASIAGELLKGTVRNSNQMVEPMPLSLGVVPI